MKFPFDMRCELNSYKTQFAKVKRGKSEIILKCPQKKKSIGIYVIFISFNSALRLKVCLPGLGFFFGDFTQFYVEMKKKNKLSISVFEFLLDYGIVTILIVVAAEIASSGKRKSLLLLLNSILSIQK